ncbi:hypothetical protein FCM35_KLT14238 [Carex littledalei]|uniref:DUF629 domain-containing protein n=1 Tax=Carex littledalei TaxID=544730 RepID=A0A833QNH8_9POAL|nr:hypothetical protein FCM35_KLT14238 [Carex littledalei]
MGVDFNPGCTSHLQWEPYCCFRDPDKLNCVESHFERELYHLELVNELQCLESQLCQLCAVNYKWLDTVWFSKINATFLCGSTRLKILLGGALRQRECESATGETEGTGPFFWIPTYDVLRHCAKYRYGVGCKSLWEGTRRFRLNKAWKYSLCYSCDETFVDQESHMVHLEDKHQLCLAHDDYWLIPKKDSRDEVEEFRRDEVEEFRQDEVKSEPGLEDSITLDHTYRYFLVDSTKFNQIPSANEEEELGQAKRKEYMEIVDGLHSELCDLRRLFRTKREYLSYLEVVNSLSLMLFNGGQPLALIVCWLRKLSIMDQCTDTTHQLQFRFLS